MTDRDSESERKRALLMLEGKATGSCRNAFDTSALALADMEQASLAYGRRYVRLEIDPGAFLSTPAPGPPEAGRRVPVLGFDDTVEATGATSARRLSGLALSRAFIPRDSAGASARLAARRLREDQADPGAGEPAPPPPTTPIVPVVRPTSFGIRDVVGWIPVPPGGFVAEPPPDVPPGIYLVERYRLASYARGFGLGDHLYSFTLFPEEEVEIEIKTWKSREQVDRTGSSIFDGQSDSSETDFAKAVEQENTTTSRKDRALEAHAEMSVEASWGVGSAEVSGGVAASSARSVEEFARNVSNASQKLANKATRERRVEITQSSEVKTIEGEETRTLRRIRNINKGYTLNYNYFQLLRKYETRLEIYDIKVRFSSGRPFWNEEEAAWRYEAEEVPLALAPILLRKVLASVAVDSVLATIVLLLGKGTVEAPGLDILKEPPEGSNLQLDTVPLAQLLAWEDAARSAVARGETPLPRPAARLPKVLSREERVIATNGVYVESMLGKCSANEDYIQDSRVLEIEMRQLEARKAALELERMKLEQAQFERDPVPRRVVRLEGLPEHAAVHLHVDDTRASSGTVVSSDDSD